MSENDEWNFEELMDKAEAQGQSVTIISPDMMKKRIVWDVVPCDMAPQVASRLGLQPASEEVEDMEHRQSHQRLVDASMLAPVAGMMSQQAAEAVRGAMLVEHGDEAGEEEILQVEKLTPLIFTTAYAIIAEMIDTGLLHIGPYNEVPPQ